MEYLRVIGIEESKNLIVGQNKGLIKVKDKNGNLFRIDKHNKRILSGELIIVNLKKRRKFNKNGII